jgi:hypothetical protein
MHDAWVRKGSGSTHVKTHVVPHFRILERNLPVCVSLSKQCGELQYLREVMGRLGVEKSGNQTVISKQSLWGVIEGVTRVRVIRRRAFWLRQVDSATIAIQDYLLLIYCTCERFRVRLYQDRMTDLRNTSFAPSSCAAQLKTPKLSPVPSAHSNIALRAVSLSGHHPNNERLHFARCRRTAQDPPDCPHPYHQLPHHSRQTTRKATCFRFVLPLLFFPDGWTSHPSAFQAA